jgi:isopropylmalate/homocitrate/citramalate synthase
MIVIVAYVLCRYGYKGRRIKQMLNSITDVADSINKGYITHKDLEDIMLEEYEIQLCDNNGDVRRI